MFFGGTIGGSHGARDSGGRVRFYDHEGDPEGPNNLSFSPEHTPTIKKWKSPFWQGKRAVETLPQLPRMMRCENKTFTTLVPRSESDAELGNYVAQKDTIPVS